MNKYTKSRKSYLQTSYKYYGHERYVLSFSENVLIDWACLMSFGSSFQLQATENLKAFLAILVLTFRSIKLYFAFLVPALWMSLDIVNSFYVIYYNKLKKFLCRRYGVQGGLGKLYSQVWFGKEWKSSNRVLLKRKTDQSEQYIDEVHWKRETVSLHWHGTQRNKSACKGENLLFFT